MGSNWFKKKENSPLDLATIDSREKAIAAHQQGQLEKVYLMPLECGGAESDANLVYAPPFVKTLKDRHNQMVVQWLEEGKQLGYEVNPEYKGDSVIPAKLTIVVNGEVDFTESIEIW